MPASCQGTHQSLFDTPPVNFFQDDTQGLTRMVLQTPYNQYITKSLAASPIKNRGACRRPSYKPLATCELQIDPRQPPTSPYRPPISPLPYPERVQRKETASSETVSCAVGESRTHTPQRALPPQSSVSTISPLPQMDWECKVNAKK